ncbi:MAG: UDP-N-acetylglucosamine 2-epimerase (non-hydrolyzing) [Cellvibrionaceae bacterium]|nr:UDP-N-acetylglucosamine 2-epimerase (non-hydrolyzing) [Cellvibrionaceae bacterium]
MAKALTVFGTRPEAIKMAPVVKALADSASLQVEVCISGQHPAMIQPALTLFSINTDYQLEVMESGQSLARLFSKLVSGIGEVLSESKPDVVLVHGDTATTLAASLAAYFERIPVAHVEAGLRTHNIYSPWPEEANRRLTGGVARWHFAPTQGALQNLLDESCPADTIHVVGNTVIDALTQVRGMIETDSHLRQQCDDKFNYLDPAKRLVLVTGHRRESFGSGFENICQAIAQIAARDDVQILYPVHLNPQVREPVNRILAGLDNVFLVEPEDYLPFVYLINRAHLLLTDSGGIQEEAPALGKPVLVMRDTTERPEAVAAGTARLVGTDFSSITDNVNQLLDSTEQYQQMATASNPFGDGRAAQRIVDVLEKELQA